MAGEESKAATLYYASCSAGLEQVLLDELRQKLNNVCVHADRVPQFGGAVFYTDSNAEDVFRLRSADNVYAFLGHFADLPLDKEKAMDYLKSLIPKLNWESALELFWKCQQVQSREVVPPLSFRVTCDRKCLKMRKHPFSSVDAAAALGDGIQSLHGWAADMRGYKAEVFGWIRDTNLLLLFGLVYSKKKKTVAAAEEGKPTVPPRPSRSDSQLYSRRPYRKALVVTSLKPSVAYALLQLGHIQPGDIVLDPMCGCGTIPLEAADFFRNQVMCLGGDISPKAVAAAGENIQQGSAQCDLLQWDASFLPMRSGCVNWVICDMPFGVRCGSTQARDWLCPKVVHEVSRVLVPGTGVAVLMSQGRTVKKEMETTPYLKLLQHFEADMEGILVEIFVAQRTTEPIQPKMERRVWKKQRAK